MPATITPDQAGCWLDGHFGWHNHYRVVDIALELGWSPDDLPIVKRIRDAYEANYDTGDPIEITDDDGDAIDVHEAVIGQGGLVDEATDYLQSLAPEGYWFEWDMGELCLVPIDDED